MSVTDSSLTLLLLFFLLITQKLENLSIKHKSYAKATTIDAFEQKYAYVTSLLRIYGKW